MHAIQNDRNWKFGHLEFDSNEFRPALQGSPANMRRTLRTTAMSIGFAKVRYVTHLSVVC